MQPTNTNVASPTFAVEMRDISKRFGSVLASDNVSLSVRSGTVHGLIGENGAGKSTLMSILYGFYTADSGQIFLNGKPVNIANSTQAIAAGIGMVHQHFMLVDNLSALDNILLGAESGFFLTSIRSQSRKRLEKIMAQHHLHLDLDEIVERMPVGTQQRLEILKALYRKAKVLILDEPTAVLTPNEVEHFCLLLQQLQGQGVTIIVITHKLDEIMRMSQYVTIMRGGRVVLNAVTEQTTPAALAEAMVGREIRLPKRQTHAAATPPSASKPPVVRLDVQNLSYRDDDGVLRVNDLSFQLAAGEILGIAGVSGNGQTELLSLLAGLLRPSQGRMRLTQPNLATSNGQESLELEDTSHDFDAKNWIQAAQLHHLNVAFIPEDRLGEGLIKAFSVQESAILGYQSQPDFGPWCHLRPDLVRAFSQTLIAKFDVRPPLPEVKSANLSGGNQQKLILAREMASHPSILLVGQPTRGVDIGAIEQIYHALLLARAAGTAIVLVSVELEEIFALSDRILVMNQGSIQGERQNTGQTSAADIGLLMGKKNISNKSATPEKTAHTAQTAP